MPPLILQFATEIAAKINRSLNLTAIPLMKYYAHVFTIEELRYLNGTMLIYTIEDNWGPVCQKQE